MDIIPNQLNFKAITEFFICGTCGKVYWEGSHFDRVCDQFKHVLDLGNELQQKEQLPNPATQWQQNQDQQEKPKPKPMQQQEEEKLETQVPEYLQQTDLQSSSSSTVVNDCAEEYNEDEEECEEEVDYAETLKNAGFTGAWKVS